MAIQDIINVVTREFHVRISDLQSKKRSKSITLPRQVCMYLARKLMDSSLEEVGGYFGGRDHTTVLHSCDKIQQKAMHDQDFSLLLEKLSDEVRKD